MSCVYYVLDNLWLAMQVTKPVSIHLQGIRNITPIPCNTPPPPDSMLMLLPPSEDRSRSIWLTELSCLSCSRNIVIDWFGLFSNFIVSKEPKSHIFFSIVSYHPDTPDFRVAVKIVSSSCVRLREDGSSLPQPLADTFKRPVWSQQEWEMKVLAQHTLTSSKHNSLTTLSSSNGCVKRYF